MGEYLGDLIQLGAVGILAILVYVFFEYLKSEAVLDREHRAEMLKACHAQNTDVASKFESALGAATKQSTVLSGVMGEVKVHLGLCADATRELEATKRAQVQPGL